MKTEQRDRSETTAMAKATQAKQHDYKIRAAQTFQTIQERYDVQITENKTNYFQFKIGDIEFRYSKVYPKIKIVGETGPWSTKVMTVIKTSLK